MSTAIRSSIAVRSDNVFGKVPSFGGFSEFIQTQTRSCLERRHGFFVIMPKPRSVQRHIEAGHADVQGDVSILDFAETRNKSAIFRKRQWSAHSQKLLHDLRIM